MNLYRAITLALCCIAPPASLAQQPKTSGLFIQDVSIIDGLTDAPQSGVSILITDGRIASIGSEKALKPPDGIEILDGRGKFLIPGLWNMHVHLGSYETGKKALIAYLAQGVTGVRDMASPLEDILKLRQDSADGKILAPTLVAAGPMIQGPLPFQMPMFVSVQTEAEARAEVTTLKTRGVDFIKIQDAIPHDLYLAVADQARKEHLPYVGHIPPTVLAEEASALGQHSIEHLGGRFWGVLLASSSKETELHQQEVQMYQDILAALANKRPPSPTNMRAVFTRSIVESYDPQKAAALIAIFRKNYTWQCPTLVVLPKLWDDGETQYTPEDLIWSTRLLALNSKMVLMMQNAGVGLLAGTDMPPDAANGTIHDELAALVQAGLTPIQALRAATANPAEFLGQSSQIGTIQQGKIANLVLLGANPLEDIRNTRKISAVILKGQVVKP
jgi:imidazolonepropionase-like amidohydrolase